MYVQVEKQNDYNKQLSRKTISQKQSGRESNLELADNLPEAIAQKKLQEIAYSKPCASQTRGFQKIANSSSQVQQAIELQSKADHLVEARMISHPPVIQRLVSGDTMNVWDQEHNQTIALDSGNANTPEKSVSLDGGNITVNVSEHAANHFVNRHTIKEFSFKDENIKDVNSFWETGQTKATVADRGVTVIKGLEKDIKEKVSEGGGAVFSKNNKVAGLTVGYNITLDADDASLNLNSGNFSRGSGIMNMLYPEGPGYDYYSTAELKYIRDKLQTPPYNKVLQLKQKEGSQINEGPSASANVR